jgi:hypothetical protein
MLLRSTSSNNNDTDTLSAEASQMGTFLDASSKQDMRRLIADIDKPRAIHFMTRGAWSMYDLLLYIVTSYHPVNIYITTYSMTELSARIIAQLCDSGLIASLTIVMDQKSQMRYPNVDQILRNIATVAYTPLHAKVLCVEHGYNCFTVVGSANWTRNRRIETGVIDYSQGARQYITWIKSLAHDN